MQQLNISAKCSEKGCPMPAEGGTIICRYHRQFFAYDVSMTDRGIDCRTDSDTGMNVEGLFIEPRRKRANTVLYAGDEYLLALYHKLLGSSSLINGVVRSLEAAPASIIKDWSANHEAAQELFERARFADEGAFCPICGCRDMSRYLDGFRVIWHCKLCRFQTSILRMTVLSDTHLGLTKWVKAIDYLRVNHERGVITRLSQTLDCQNLTAWRLHHLLRMTGQVTGLNLGADFPIKAKVINKLRNRLLYGVKW